MRRIMAGVGWGVGSGLLGLALATAAMAQDAQKPSGPTLEDLQRTIQAQSAQIEALQQSVNALATAGKTTKPALLVNAYPRPFDIEHSPAMRRTTTGDAGDICRKRLGAGAFATGLEQVSPTQVIFTCQVPETP